MASEGVLGATELLVVEVAAEDARSELLAAENNVAASQTALRGVLGVDTTDIVPVTPMFVADSLPSSSFFRSSAESNYLVRGLSHQITAAELRRRMSRGGYAPTVALLGKQTIYSHGINRHLMPRSVVGVGVTWTLFDGLQREHEIGAARLAVVNSRLAHSSALSQTSVAIERLLAELHNAAARVRSGRRTVALNRRVLDNRRREWNEGVASIDRVVDAEVALASARVALLAAYYAYDVALMGLLAVCGCPDMFYELAARAVDVPSYDE
jgi:outer membrane protein TolC